MLDSQNADSLDLGDPRSFKGRDHFETWRRARQQHPIQWVESESAGCFWSVTAHGLALEILNHPEIFESGSGMRLGAAASGVAAASNRMLVVADGDAHNRLRSAHAPWFTSANSKRIGELLRAEIETMMLPLINGEAVDVVAGLSDAVPTCVMAQMLGTELEETAEVSQLVRTSFEDVAPVTGGQKATSVEHAAASAKVFGYFHKLVRDRRSDLGSDIISQLMRPLETGGFLNTQEVLLNADGLVNGGLGTSRHAISGTIEAFARNPEQWAKLREWPSLLRGAVEEVLRWSCPPMHVMRTARSTAQIGEMTVHAGDRVVIWLPSCNRDETVFDNADSFDIERRANPHLTLGAGPHYCVGAAVGRLEIRALLQVMVQRVSTIELCGEPERSASSFLNGSDRLEVRMFPDSKE